jgi:putative inorganic carbon (hco3(-)) transporter
VPRLVWLVKIGVFTFALAMTHSRGGFLGLLVGLACLLLVRFGIRKTIGLSLIVMPSILLAVGGRLTQISTSTGTAHKRIEIWSDYFVEWRQSPLYGLGMNNYANVGSAAHNSFMQSYVDLGLSGGTFFLGAFFLSILLPYRMVWQGNGLPEGELRRFQPYLIGIIAGYMMGMLSSSINYIVPTYTLLGLAAAHARLAGVYFPSNLTTLNGLLVRRVLQASCLTVLGLYLYTRITLAQG